MRPWGDLATTPRLAAAVVVAMMSVGAAPALAEITVTTTSDPGGPGDGQCSLREAIALSADCPGAAPSGATTIRVPAGTYTLTDQLTVAGTANLDIRGASTSDPSQTTIRRASDAPPFRLLLINGGAIVKLDGLTLTGGRAPDGTQGASVGTNGPNGAGGVAGTPGGAGSPGNPGSSGGGILNNGTLLIDHSVIASNVAGSGGAGRPGGKGGNGGKGTAAGTNDGGVGANGGAGGAGGAGGRGGGIFNAGSLTIAGSVIDSNVAGASGSGGSGGAGGDGGAGYDVQGYLGNGADAGDGGAGGAMGAAGNGGAIYTVGPATITATTIRFSRGSFAVTSAGAGGAGGKWRRHRRDVQRQRG